MTADTDVCWLDCGRETWYVDVLGIPWCKKCWDEVDHYAARNAHDPD